MTTWKVWPNFKNKSATGPRKSIYADLYVKGSRRARFTPRVARPYRVKKLAWGGLMTFYRNRFYEIDRWYKARIEKPEKYPDLHLIDPDKIVLPLTERLKILNAKDPDLHQPVDIGLPYQAPNVGVEHYKQRREHRKNLEQLARLRTLKLDVKEVEEETWKATWPQQLARLAHHFGIFQDLFHEDAYFHPVIPLKVEYDVDDEFVAPVYFGNSITPQDASIQPTVSYEVPDSNSEKMFMLLMVNPDGNPLEENKELVHWMICNIPGSDLSKGEIFCDYMQPLPLRGTGWHRMVFLLFQQEGRVENLSGFCREKPDRNLEERTLDTKELYKNLEDSLTPAGLAFFQCQWDISCRDFMHHKLGLEMPMYEYEWPAPSIKKQEEYPEERVPFNLYLDKYRSTEEIEEEMLKKRLKKISPFGANLKPEKYPDIFWYDNKHSMSTWQHSELRREHLGFGRYKGLYENRIK